MVWSISEVDGNIQNNIPRSDIIYGKNAVFEFLKSGGTCDTLYLTSEDDKSYRHIVLMAKQVDAVIKKIHPAKLQRLCGSDHHQGVALQCVICEYMDLDVLLERCKEAGQPPFLVVADGIEDPHNLGAIIRSAECSGAHGVVIPERRSCSVTATVFRSSAGACSHIPIARVGNLARAVQRLKDEGIFCYSADAEGVNCYEVDLRGACAIIVGSEGSGVSHLIKQMSDKVISIPLLGKISSLNASVSAGILMYEYRRQSTEREGKLG